jgi:hypothetical protein
MTTGLQRLVRRALLTTLKADAGVKALVPASSMNPKGLAQWPFIVLRTPTTQPLRAACVRGGIVAWDIHAFAGVRKNAAKAVIETAEDHAGRIGAAIEAAIGDRWLDIEGGGRARIRLSDIRLAEDGDQDHYHYFAQINARVLAA